jgi:hypothetical protein
MHIGYWWESQKERDHWEDQDVGGWTILKWILERYDVMEWIDMAQDRNQWRALVNTVLNLRVPYNAGKFLSGCTIGGSSRWVQLSCKQSSPELSQQHVLVPALWGTQATGSAP